MLQSSIIFLDQSLIAPQPFFLNLLWIIQSFTFSLSSFPGVNRFLFASLLSEDWNFLYLMGTGPSCAWQQHMWLNPFGATSTFSPGSNVLGGCVSWPHLSQGVSIVGSGRGHLLQWHFLGVHMCSHMGIYFASTCSTIHNHRIMSEIVSW